MLKKMVYDDIQRTDEVRREVLNDVREANDKIDDLCCSFIGNEDEGEFCPIPFEEYDQEQEMDEEDD
jgi:hypothetical protein